MKYSLDLIFANTGATAMQSCNCGSTRSRVHELLFAVLEAQGAHPSTFGGAMILLLSLDTPTRVTVRLLVCLIVFAQASTRPQTQPKRIRKRPRRENELRPQVSLLLVLTASFREVWNRRYPATSERQSCIMPLRFPCLEQGAPISSMQYTRSPTVAPRNACCS